MHKFSMNICMRQTVSKKFRLIAIHFSSFHLGMWALHVSAVVGVDYTSASLALGKPSFEEFKKYLLSDENKQYLCSRAAQNGSFPGFFFLSVFVFVFCFCFCFVRGRSLI